MMTIREALNSKVMMGQDCGTCAWRALDNCLACYKVKRMQEIESDMQRTFQYMKEINGSVHHDEGRQT